MRGDARHLLVIGGQRCGTTTLHRMLDAHPDITMARPARPEPKVFCSDAATDRGAEEYRRTWFAHADTEALLGDKSTSYLEDPGAPARAARMLGRVEVVALLRDPVARAVSNWRFSTDNGLEQRGLEQALRDNLDRTADWDPRATSVSPYAYLERGRYAGYLRGWLTRFPDTTQVLFLDELLAHPQRTFEDLCRRLRVSPAAQPVGPVPTLNTSRSPAPALSATLTGALDEYFRTSDAELATLLGREIPWRVGAGVGSGR